MGECPAMGHGGSGTLVDWPLTTGAAGRLFDTRVACATRTVDQ